MLIVLAIRRTFYSACNGVLYKCKREPENIQLYLVQTFCLPLLMYCMGALTLAQRDVVNISVCWNDAFRKNNDLQRWQSVAPVQFFTNNLSFKLLYNYYSWNFSEEIRSSYKGNVPNLVKFIFETRKWEQGFCAHYEDVYNYHGDCRHGR